MAKEVSKTSGKIFLDKAEEFHSEASHALESKRFDTAMFNATQAIFLANDAFCIYLLGRRPSKDHKEAVNLFSEAAQRLGDARMGKLIAEAFDERSESGYTEKLTKPDEAVHAIINARKFINWVKEKIS